VARQSRGINVASMDWVFFWIVYPATEHPVLLPGGADNAQASVGWVDDSRPRAVFQETVH